MSQERRQRSPSERFHALMRSITADQMAEIERRMTDPECAPSTVKWRDDPDPFGGDWGWLSPETDVGERGGPSTATGQH